MMICIGQQYVYGFKSSHRSKSFIEINSFNLCVALSYQSCLIPHHKAIFILLVAVDPLCANDIVLARIWTFNQFQTLLSSN